MNDISDTQAAYCAGCIDGDGFISINKDYNKNSYKLKIGIINTNEKLMDWLVKTTEIGKVNERKNHNFNWKNKYQWYLLVFEIKEFLIRIRPFLRIKDRQADLVLEFLELRKAHRFNPLSIEERNLRESIYEQMKDLNRRGLN